MRIVHCLRSPLGGLFRHVRDLAEAQAADGHEVGILCDSLTGGVLEEEALGRLSPSLALGLVRLPMRRQISPSDLLAARRVLQAMRKTVPDILHGHGAKGGAYARMIGTRLRASGTRVARIYTPHGGSLHYDAHSLKGRVYAAAERLLGRLTDGFVFVCRYEADAYAAKVGAPRRPATVIHNGLRPEEFVPVAAAPDAADFVFVGELRALKGVDLLIEALALLRDRGGPAPTAHVVGSGPDRDAFVALAAARGLGAGVAFHPPMPARRAFALGRAVVVPSRAESLPYLVLEAVGAGRPLVATRVGGIPEIFGAEADALVAPGDAAALAAALAAMRERPEEGMARARRLHEAARERFSAAAMAAAITRFYGEARAG